MRFNGEMLVKGTDYTLTYSDNLNAGTGSVRIQGKGNYQDSIDKPFTIQKAVQPASAKAAASTIVVGKTTKVQVSNRKESAKVLYSLGDKTKTLSVNTAGDITAKKAGTGKIVVNFAATKNYKAVTKSFSVSVNPKPTTIISVQSSAKGKAVVKWSKNASCTGYEIQYSPSSQFKSGNKTAVSGKPTNVSATLSKLTCKKRYYVRIRTYNTVSGKKYYSTWSGAKNVVVAAEDMQKMWVVSKSCGAGTQGGECDYTYDENGLVQQMIPNLAPALTFTYKNGLLTKVSDNYSDYSKMQYDSKKRMKSRTVYNGKTQYTYNGKNQVVKSMFTASGSAYSYRSKYETKYVYDKNGNVTKTIGKEGAGEWITTYTYDKKGNFTGSRSETDNSITTYTVTANLN